MFSVRSLLVVLMAGFVTLFDPVLAFSGDFEITNLVADSPFEADPTSTANSFVSFDFSDQDTPQIAPTHCSVEWKVGTSPSNPVSQGCDNTTFSVNIPDDSYHGVENFFLSLAHQYIDNSVGEPPMNVLTKFGGINLTYPDTTNYECDFSKGRCDSCEGAVLIAKVTAAVA